MPAARTPLLLFVVTMLSAGCATPWTTRLPTLAFSSPGAEKRAYERHDPFPIEELGPDTQTRPRGFIEPRTEERKATESRIMNNLQPESASPFPNVPMTGSTYPDVVSP